MRRDAAVISAQEHCAGPSSPRKRGPSRSSLIREADPLQRNATQARSLNKWIKRAASAPCFFLLAALLLVITPAGADTPPQAAIASAHPLATQAGIEIINEGGNAFDAAIGVAAALAVVEPYSSGVGGGGFFLLHRAADGRQVMIDARETAPAGAHRRMYLDKHDQVIPNLSREGPLSAGIPGFFAGIAWLADQYGRLPLSKTLEPAIRYARDGFVVSEEYVSMAGYRTELMKRWPDSARIFLQDGAAPQAGFRLVQKDLGKLLENVGKYGASYFYHGEFARRMVDGVRAAGGNWTLPDLANYHVREREPLVFDYNGIRIVSAPPPSSGGIVLAQALTILEHFDLESMDYITRKHVIIEAMRRAYRDRAVFLGDPDFTRIPTDRLLNEDYLAGLAVTINPGKATPSTELGDTPGWDAEGNNTTHFSIIDTEGNRVGATLSINLPFGSGFVPPGTGVLLNDEMDDFAIKEGTPNAFGLVGFDANAVQPGKRPLSSMSPTFVETEDRVGILGTPGGSRIISMVLLGILEFARGAGPHDWVSYRRFHHQYLPDEVVYEPGGLTEYELERLKALGHTVKEAAWRYGDMHAVEWNRDSGRVTAASDPRGGGLASVFTPR